MATSKRIPKLKEDCIPYIESCGWKYTCSSGGAHWFKGENGRKTMSGSNEICFSLRELRDAVNYGW